MLFSKTPEGYVSTGAFVGIFYEGAILVIFMILLISLYRIYRTTKLKMTLTIFLGFLFYIAAVFCSWLAKWYLWTHAEDALEGDYLIQLIYTFKFSMVFVVIANFFILSFFRSFFGKDTTKLRNMIYIVIKVIEIIIILTIHIPAYLARSSEIAQTTNAIGFFIMFLDMLFTIPCGIKSFKSAKKEAFGKKYISIGIMSFCLFGFCILFFFDRVTMVLGIPGPFGELGYSGFYFAAWMSVIVALIFAIKGSVLK